MADVDDDKLVETGAVSKADKDFNAKVAHFAAGSHECALRCDRGVAVWTAPNVEGLDALQMEAELEKKKLDENPESWSKKREEIHEICERGDVVALIAHLKTEAGRKARAQHPPRHRARLAASQRRVCCLQTLEKPDPSGWRPLHWAASNNRNKIRALFMLKQEDANNLMLVQEERDNIRKTFVTVRTLRGQQCIGMHVRAKEF